MRKLLASLLVAALAAAMTLAAVGAMAWVASHTSAISHAAVRTVATIAEIAAGIFWLLATVYIVTQLAVLIFAEKDRDGES